MSEGVARLLARLLVPQGLRALRSPYFRFYAAATFISQVGIYSEMLARTWLVATLSDGLLFVGLMGFASNLGDLLAGLWLSHRLKPIDPRAALFRVQAAHLGISVLLVGLAAGGTLEAWQLVGVALCRGLLNAPQRALGSSIAVQSVDVSEVPSVSGVLGTLGSVARMGGPALGGVLLMICEPWVVFAFDAATYLPLLVVLRPAADRARSRAPAPLDEAPLSRLPRALAVALLCVVTPGVFGIPYMTLLPGIARDLGDGTTLGTLWAAVGIGSLVGGLLAVHRGSRFGGRLPPRLGLLALAQAVAIVAASRFAEAPFAAVLGAVGLAAGSNSLFMAIVAGYVGVVARCAGARTRIFAVYYTVLLACMAVSELAIGALGDLIGAAAALQGIGLAAAAWAASLVVLLSRARPARLDPESGEDAVPSLPRRAADPPA